MAVAGAVLAHVFNQSMYTYVWTNHCTLNVTQGSCCARRVADPEVGADKVPQNSILKTLIVPSSCSADTIKQGVASSSVCS